MSLLRTVRLRGVVAFAVVAVLWDGCTHSSTAPGDGSLVVSITAPSGVAPHVVVTGPGGYQRDLSATETLTGLSPGSYVVTATSVETVAPVVSVVQVGGVGGSPAAVSNGRTANVTVNYAPRAGSGTLWIAGNIDTTTNLIYAFTPDQLQASGAPTPAITLSIPHAPTKYGDVDALAFDTGGNLWLGHYQLNTVTEVLASSLAKSGVVSEAVTIRGPALKATQGLAFDGAGNLWVSNNLPIDSGYTIVEYSAAQLGASGSPTPVVTISGAALQGPEQMAFDASGNLWVVNSQASTVVGYTPAQLATGGALSPSVTLTTDTAIDAGTSPAFDKQGNLWLAYFFVVQDTGSALEVSTIAEYGRSALVASGSPARRQTIVVPPTSSEPWQLAFDNSSDLWVITNNAHQLLEYTAAQLAGGGNPSPAVTISLGAIYPTGLAFSPHSPELPLH